MRAGARRDRIVLTERDRLVLSTLGQVRVATGAQVRILAGFHSKTRANARLLKLARAGLLHRTFIGTIVGGRSAAYSLRGARSGPTSRRLHLEHQLGVTDAYAALVAAGPPSLVSVSRFELGAPALVPSEFSIIPDAFLELSAASGVRAYFLEVDRGTEARPVWVRKARGYLALAESGVFEGLFGPAQFGVLVVAHSRRRTEGIRRAVRGVTGKLFYFTDFESLKCANALSPLWLRPEGESVASLT